MKRVIPHVNLKLSGLTKNQSEVLNRSFWRLLQKMQYSVVIVVALAAGAMAGQSGYNNPPPVYGPPQEEAYVPQVFKHVYVHTAPDDAAEVQNRVIRVPGGDKHVNIIFVKTPSQSSSSQTEVILPEQDEHKNLVYVLLKKGENSNDVKIRRPAAQRPQKPEVYFIRYKGQEGYADSSPPPPTYGLPAAPTPVRTPSSTYGTPF